VNGDLRVSSKITALGYSANGGNINAYNIEVGGVSPSITNGNATIFFHHHGAMANQLRYTSGVLYLEAAGNGYGSTSTPALQVNGPIYAAVQGGGVGIGTTNPGAYKLYINGGDLCVNRGDGLYGNIKLTGHSFVGSADWGNLTLGAGSNAGNATLFLNTENTTKMTILGNGNVGIGTTTPTSKLQVVGNAAIGQFTNGTAVIDAFSGYAYYGCNNATNGLSIGSTGNIGIGITNSSSYKLYVAGSAYSTGGWSGSDVRWKKNIIPVSSVLSKLMQVTAVNYEWKTDEYKDLNFDTGKQLGIIAQDVEKVFPELVKTDINGYKAVAYEKLSVLLLEGMKEQEQKIQQLEEQNALFKSELEAIKAELSRQK
jgi:hypothetical protein